jgi:hypothetical protein
VIEYVHKRVKTYRNVRARVARIRPVIYRSAEDLRGDFISYLFNVVSVHATTSRIFSVRSILHASVFPKENIPLGHLLRRVVLSK